MKPAGYAGTPLARKLGIKENARLLSMGAPKDYVAMVEPLPDGVRIDRRAGAAVDVVHMFVTKRADLRRQLSALRKTLRSDAAIWVSWPKRTSKVAIDITEDTIRDVALPMGLVDIKVCAVSDVWSGLKLVVRKELR
jgi:hypothetical protein